jgi:glycosyltransferase involved in cell wall biosynthesis
MTKKENKLIYLSYSAIPSPHANSLQVMEMCHALADTGMDIELYALKTSISTPAAHFYDLPAKQIRIHRIRMPRIKLISRFLYGLCVVAKLFGNSQKAIIYGRDFFTMALLTVMPTKRDQPLFFEAHQPPQSRLEEALQSLIFKSNAFAGLLTISQALKEAYLQRFPFLQSAQVEVLPDAARPLKHLAETTPNNPPILGYVGSLQAGKGIETISKIASLRPDFEFHIVGGTPQQIKKWKNICAENVIFYGHQPTAQVQELIQKFDILLAPYQGSVKVGRKQVDIARWMSPLKIFEYMAAARPLVASNLPVLKEVLQHKSNCLLATPDDPDDWIRQINRLRTDDALRASLGQQAYRDFIEHYTWQKRAQKLLHFFGHILLESRTPVS